MPIEIPTKRYIKAYLRSQLGEKPVMNTTTAIGSKFYDLLQHETNEDKNRFAEYNTHMKIYVSYHIFYHRGAFLNETNIKGFNSFVEAEIKRRFRDQMDFYLSIFPNFMANLPAVRKHLGIDVGSWDDDSMKKDYYRYRKRNGKPLLYKNSEPISAFGRHLDPAF